MPRYKKKPVVVNVQMIDNIDFQNKPEALEEWVKDAIIKGTIEVHEDQSLTIHTLEGDHQVTKGNDVLIQGVEGEIYPCKKGIFHKTYEKHYDIVENPRKDPLRTNRLPADPAKFKA